LKYPTRIRFVTVATLAIALFSTYGAFAQTETLRHTFTGGNDGSEGGNLSSIGSDAGNLVFDPSGNLYGSAMQGGTAETVCGAGCGVIYELSPDGSGDWAQNTLHMFTALLHHLTVDLLRESFYPVPPDFQTVKG
jgi:uncharacterized repeat protein (TIGR03803 family)